MNHLNFPEANVRLPPPEDLPNCEMLVAHRFEADPEADVPPGYLSRWHPTAAERDAIAAGGDVWVFVYTNGGPPPISVQGVSPFEEQPMLDARAVFADAFDAYQAETGQSPLHDWKAWEIWALEHPTIFVGLTAEDFPQHLARLRTQAESPR